MNDSGTQQFDNAGLPTGIILSANGGGTQQFDDGGLPSPYLQTMAGRPARLLTGVGI